MSELAEWLTLSRGGITKLVDRLQEAGYLERVSCSSDRRSLHAQLTPAGEKMLEEMRARLRGRDRPPPRDADRRGVPADHGSLQKVTGSTCAKARAKPRPRPSAALTSA